MSKRKQHPTMTTKDSLTKPDRLGGELVARDLTDPVLRPAGDLSHSNPHGPIPLRKNSVKSEPQEGGLFVEGGANDPIELDDTPRLSTPPILQRKIAIKRDEVMEQGRHLLHRLGNRDYNQRDLIDEMDAWLDEHRVKVLTDEAKGKVYIWGWKYDRKFTFWVHRAYENLSEYSYVDDERFTQPILAWRDMIKEPLREMEQIATGLGGDGQQRILRVVGNLQKGMAWLDWQEQRRHAQREAAADQEKRVRGEFSAATTRATISHEALNVSRGKLDELLRKTDEVLVAVTSKDGGPSKKRRVESTSTSSKRGQIANDAQHLVDNLVFNLPSSRAICGQLEKILNHFDLDIVKNLDYDRERCLARRRKRIGDILGSNE
ncbi:hypothetical protein G7Z17_g3251 [Cylindrodendrum hubeiense]|uniref:Uncharacterized protein n=1 Tax=Cylindrodendrum hubeiense TaxID=595255 RepID=A0A9P5LAZ0_9HYPO|nr:hypothetical protein G7Z17_g3251 [Cylindrodendrum hubeiense]